MTRALLLVLLVASGCYIRNGGVVRAGEHGLEGGAVTVELVSEQARAGMEVGYERVTEEVPNGADRRRGVFTIDYALRWGIRAQPPESERLRINFGVAAGAGFAVTSDYEGRGHIFGGGWLDVRLTRAEKPPVLRLEVQLDGYTNTLVGGPQVMLGVAWEFEQKSEKDSFF